LENEDLASLIVVAPTVIAEGALAGDLRQASPLSLPAATTTVTPLFVNLAIAPLLESLSLDLKGRESTPYQQ
jgi:hypothetical protein